jgi:glycosyltransferase involved in cell wall biosynthesis
LSAFFLSIIIPAHNEENRLPATLEQVARFIRAQPYASEVLIVENGSHDNTLKIAQEFAERNAGFRAIHETGRGKGLAIQRGMLEAQGDYRFMCDADLSMPIDEISRFLPPVLPDADIAVASREAPGAVRYHEPTYRHLGGRAINTIIRWLVLPGLQDTQCGFKCFRADVAQDLFPYQTLKGWSFDIEILFIARQRAYRIVEIPIPWYFNPDSKLHAVNDALRMGMDIVRIRRNAMQGLYKSIPPADRTPTKI